MGYGPRVRLKWLNVGQVLFSLLVYGARRSRSPLGRKKQQQQQEQQQQKNRTIMSDHAWSIKDLLRGKKNTLFLAGHSRFFRGGKVTPSCPLR